MGSQEHEAPIFRTVRFSPPPFLGGGRCHAAILLSNPKETTAYSAHIAPAQPSLDDEGTRGLRIAGSLIWAGIADGAGCA
jgi:hypothetical protein